MLYFIKVCHIYIYIYGIMNIRWELFAVGWIGARGWLAFCIRVAYYNFGSVYRFIDFLLFDCVLHNVYVVVYHNKEYLFNLSYGSGGFLNWIKQVACIKYKRYLLRFLVLSWGVYISCTSSRNTNSDVNDLNNDCDWYNSHFMNIKEKCMTVEFWYQENQN